MPRPMSHPQPSGSAPSCYRRSLASLLAGPHLGPPSPGGSTGPRATSPRHWRLALHELLNVPVPLPHLHVCHQGPWCPGSKETGPLLSFLAFPWASQRAGCLSDYPVSFLAFPGLASLSYQVFSSAFPGVSPRLDGVLPQQRNFPLTVPPSPLILGNCPVLPGGDWKAGRSYPHGHQSGRAILAIPGVSVKL